jgi:hypothetical protein
MRGLIVTVALVCASPVVALAQTKPPPIARDFPVWCSANKDDCDDLVAGALTRMILQPNPADCQGRDYSTRAVVDGVAPWIKGHPGAQSKETYDSVDDAVRAQICAAPLKMALPPDPFRASGAPSLAADFPDWCFAHSDACTSLIAREMMRKLVNPTPGDCQLRDYTPGDIVAGAAPWIKRHPELQGQSSPDAVGEAVRAQICAAPPLRNAHASPP